MHEYCRTNTGSWATLYHFLNLQLPFNTNECLVETQLLIYFSVFVMDSIQAL